LKVTDAQRNMFDGLKSSFDEKFQINEDSAGLLNSDVAGVEPNHDSTLPLIDPESGNRQLYDEFLNCKSNNYAIQEKEDSDEISSEGEFNEFKDCDMLNEDADYFVDQIYLQLIEEKYASAPANELNRLRRMEVVDQNLKNDARISI